MSRITSVFRGDGLMARVLRSASWLMIGYGGAQALRLASNLILTRILFPEAFGLMALVNVVLVGLALFSDIGLAPAITQSPRGDDPDFLDTAWTIGILRGLILWAGTLALAWPVARFYDEPDLAFYLPLAGISLIINGFHPTKMDTANRHLLVGRLTVLELASQTLSITAMVLLALMTKSVVALVFGGVMFSAIRLVMLQTLLPGRSNRLRWEKAAAHDLIHFGKWIFLSTACWFVTSQGDRAILGKFLTLEALGLYNIGYFLASFPYMLALAVNQKLMMPVYRDRPATASPQNVRRQRQMRSGMTASLGLLLVIMAFAGPWLIDFLYDDRYYSSGAVVTLVSCALIPAVIAMTYDSAALAAGDSRMFALYSASRATAQVLFVLVGVHFFGLVGAILAMAAAQLAVYPLLVWLAVRHHVWDSLHDLAFAVLGGLLAATAIWVHWDRVSAVFGAAN